MGYGIPKAQEFYHEQICFDNEPPEIDDFKALAGPSPEELDAIEDARARDELVSSVHALLQDFSGIFITEKMGFQHAEFSLPSDCDIERLKGSLIEFKDKLEAKHKMRSPAWDRCVKEIEESRTHWKKVLADDQVRREKLKAELGLKGKDAVKSYDLIAGDCK